MTQLTHYILHQADSALILSQRNSEWCGHGPVLEQDIAITNISLDLLGQARNWYQYAATIIENTDEDKLAYLRTEREFKNFIICELPKGDWALTVCRLYLFSEYQWLLFNALQKSSDAQVAAIAAKSIKETTYHVRWSKDWMLRLGDGTEESNTRLQNALEALWPYCREFFEPADYEIDMDKENIGFNTVQFKQDWLNKINETLTDATLKPMELTHNWLGIKGKQGIHTEHMGILLTELQYMQRTYPNSNW
jgi:ring-1,2-phenylacetyl-CoA epoxidase subunit PaaC